MNLKTSRFASVAAACLTLSVLLLNSVAYATGNSAPVLDSSKSPSLSGITEDAGAPTGAVGTLVSSLVDFNVPSGQVDNVTDADVGDSLGIAIVAVDTSNLTCFYSLNGGTGWFLIGSVSDSSARLLAANGSNRIYCEPNSNSNGTFSSAITFRAWDQTTGTDGSLDDASTNGGTTAFSSSSDTASLVVTAVNDAPSATNLSAAEAYTEDTALNLIDIVASDVDSSTLTVTLTLSTPVVGTLSTATSGAVTSTYNAGTGVWSASGATADVNALLAALTFTPVSNGNSSFTVSTSVSDGALSVTGSKSFTGIAVNDAPSATNLSAAETYTEDTSLNLIDIVASDVDSSNLTVTLTLSNPAAGTLSTATSGAVTSTFSTGVWTASGAKADVNTLLAGVTFVPASNFNSSFSIATSVNDGIASAITGTKTFTGTAVNDAPSATNLSAAEAYTEDTALNLVDIVASDVDSSSLTVTLTLSTPVVGTLSTATSGAVTSTYNAGTGVWSASGATADVNTLLAGLTFTPVSNGNSSFTVSTSVSDGALSVAGAKTFTGTAVNDAPTLDSSKSPNLFTIDEDPGLPTGSVGTSVSSLVDFASPSGQVDNVTDVDSSAAPGVAIIAVDTDNLACYYTLDGGLTWSAMGSVSNSSARLLAANGSERIYCQATSNNNGTFSSAITFRAWDQSTGTNGSTADASTNGGITAFSSASDTASLVVTAVNDAPSATNLSAAETYTEDTSLNLVNIVASDVDSSSLTVTLTLSDASAGTLSTATSGAVTSTYDSETGVWTASGATADVNTLLAGVTFVPVSNGNSSFTIATSVSDGALSVTGSKSFTGTAVNDAPSATNLSAAETYTEDTSLNLVNIVASDVDSSSLTATLTLSDASAGTLSTATSGAVTSTYDSETGVWTASGATADVNTLLAGVTFTPVSNGNSSFTIATSVSDGALSVTGSKSFTGTAVNDAPSASDDSYSISANADTSLLDVLNNDIDADEDTLSIVSVTTPDHGGSASIESDQIAYQPAVDFIGIETFDYVVEDPSEGQSLGHVTITVLSTAKSITAFTFPSSTETTIDEEALSITVSVPHGTEVTALVPTITITGDSVSPLSGVAQDFTSPVIYTVTAADDSTQAYTVTVEVAAASGGSGGGGGGGGGGSVTFSPHHSSSSSSTKDSQSTDSSSSTDISSSGESLYFTDIEGHWAKSYINALSSTFGISGYKDENGKLKHLFGPDDQLLRAELVEMVVKAHYPTLEAPTQKPFNDVALDAWYAPSVAKAKALGWINGYSDGQFKPLEKISRAEALKVILLSEFKDQDIPNLSPSFTDTPPVESGAAPWYYKYVAFAVQKGLVSGYVNANGTSMGLFGPNDFMLRGQVAKVLMQAIALGK